MLLRRLWSSESPRLLKSRPGGTPPAAAALLHTTTFLPQTRVLDPHRFHADPVPAF